MAVNTSSSWAALVQTALAADQKKRKTTDLSGNSFTSNLRYPQQASSLMGVNQGIANAREGDFSALGLTTRDFVSNPDITKANQAYVADTRQVAAEQRGTIPSPAPQPSESRGQLRVDLNTSPVQTADSVMYRNAGEGEESTTGEAGRPNKRKPGLSSNLGINL